jgi:kynurenine formamidase
MTGPSSLDPLLALLRDSTVIDLSHKMEEGMPSFPSQSRYFHELWNSYWHGETSVSYQIIMNEHSGTHVDAPGHSMGDGHPQHVWVDAMTPDCLIGRAVTIDVSFTGPGEIFDLDVLDAFEAGYGAVSTDDIVLFHTGWAVKWALRPNFKHYLEGWPAPSPRLCDALVARGVKAVGCDNMALDAPGSPDFPAHRILLGNGIPIMENLTNLDTLPPHCSFAAIPLKIGAGSGSPIRPLAFVPRQVFLPEHAHSKPQSATTADEVPASTSCTALTVRSSRMNRAATTAPTVATRGTTKVGRIALRKATCPS